MIPKSDFVRLVSDLAKEIADEKQWSFNIDDSKPLFDMIASSMIELFWGDRTEYSYDTATISVLSTAVFLSVENSMLYQIVLNEDY